MRIEFDEKLIKRPQDDTPLTKKEQYEWLRCADSKEYFFENYVYIQGDHGRELFHPRDYQWDIIDAAENHRYTINVAGRQCGKALALDTVVPTPRNDHTTVADILPGDYVLDENADSVLVTHISPISFNRPCYRVAFSGGEEVVADDDHLWMVLSEGRSHTLTTREIRNAMQIHKSIFSIDCPGRFSDARVLRQISSITPVKSVPVRCIRVANDSHLFCVTTSHIPTHNTTTMGVDVLHDTIFTEDYPVLITSYKGKNVKDYMSRIRFAYENLPWWLKPPCIVYNQTEIRFTNWSSIFAEVTNESTGRGTTQKRIIADELAFVNPKVSTEFMASLLPSISAAGEHATTRFNIISSANGTEGIFANLWFEALAGDNSFHPVEILYEAVPGRTPEFEKKMIADIGKARFDREFRNAFISTGGTLVNSRIMEKIKPQPPVRQMKDLDIYVESFHGRKVAMACDISEGVGEDNAVIQLVDIVTMEQIAEYGNNMVNQSMFFQDMLRTMKMLQDEGAEECYFTFENNGVGAGISRLIEHSDHPVLEWATLISDPVETGKYRSGMYTTHPKKMAGCGLLKDMIELYKLTIRSKKLLTELKFFSKKGAGFAAIAGAKDDRVMGMVVLMNMLTLLSNYEDDIDDTINDLDEDTIDDVWGIIF